LTLTSECSPRVPSTVLVGCTRHDLGLILRSTMLLSCQTVSRRVLIFAVFGTRAPSGAISNTALILSCPWRRVQSILEPTSLLVCAAQNASHRLAARPFMGSCALRRLQSRTATYTEFASPGCVASSDFLSLLTLYSVRHLPALFRAGNTLELSSSEGSPSR
jgi:hypothetical protein